MKLRFAVPEDVKALLRIYAQYIDTNITFEYVLPSEEEFAERICSFSQVYPYLVCEENGRIVGYAYAHRLQERAAYQWNAELSIYIDRDARSHGLGRRMYTALTALLRLQGVKTAYAIVTLPNERSEHLHDGMGFVRIGVMHNTGYKNGEWHDVAYFEKALAPYENDPRPVVPISEIDPAAAARALEV